MAFYSNNYMKLLALDRIILMSGVNFSQWGSDTALNFTCIKRASDESEEVPSKL